ncbi:uncharacterized protein LOC141893464 [Acropora palmata]|uniref:uncharacterized protein LOC141893464 n=1 Tax=Acropora palmata TaxID=6131 RepID=UPI003DA13346
MNSADCKSEFRVEKGDLPHLTDAIHIPAVFHCKQRSICDGLEGPGTVCAAETYKLSLQIQRYDSTFSKTSFCFELITNEVIDFIYDKHCHLVTEWNRDVLSSVALQQYAETISRKGSPLNNCFGFIHGTVRPISRPGNGQRIVYNGHKQVHGLKFQSMIALPNGLIGNIFGPVEGRKHNAGMLADSGLLKDMRNFAFSLAGQPVCVYGDPAYPLRIHLQAPYRQGCLTQQMEDYNKAMSEVRVSVEWLFGDIINSSKFLDFKKNLG